jgi:hypothetical protein
MLTGAAAAAVALTACGSPAHPAAAIKLPLTCQRLSPDGALEIVVSDLAAQASTEAAESSGLSQSVKNSTAWGAWTGPGTYAGDLNAALADEENWAGNHTPANSHPFGSIDPSWPSSPPQLSADASAFNNAGTSVSSDTAFSPSDWAAFTTAVTSLAADCGWSS